jgi:hypothetical protein
MTEREASRRATAAAVEAARKAEIEQRRLQWQQQQMKGRRARRPVGPPAPETRPIAAEPDERYDERERSRRAIAAALAAARRVEIEQRRMQMQQRLRGTG